MWEKMQIEGAIHLRSHNIPLNLVVKKLSAKSGLVFNIVSLWCGNINWIHRFHDNLLISHFPRDWFRLERMCVCNSPWCLTAQVTYYYTLFGTNLASPFIYVTRSREMNHLSKMSISIFFHTFSKLQNVSFWCKPHYNWISGYTELLRIWQC